jgi:hypothetical protein
MTLKDLQAELPGEPSEQLVRSAFAVARSAKNLPQEISVHQKEIDLSTCVVTRGLHRRLLRCSLLLCRLHREFDERNLERKVKCFEFVQGAHALGCKISELQAVEHFLRAYQEGEILRNKLEKKEKARQDAEAEAAKKVADAKAKVEREEAEKEAVRAEKAAKWKADKAQKDLKRTLKAKKGKKQTAEMAAIAKAKEVAARLAAESSDEEGEQEEAPESESEGEEELLPKGGGIIGIKRVSVDQGQRVMVGQEELTQDAFAAFALQMARDCSLYWNVQPRQRSQRHHHHHASRRLHSTDSNNYSVATSPIAFAAVESASNLPSAALSAMASMGKGLRRTHGTEDSKPVLSSRVGATTSKSDSDIFRAISKKDMLRRSIEFHKAKQNCDLQRTIVAQAQGSAADRPHREWCDASKGLSFDRIAGSGIERFNRMRNAHLHECADQARIARVRLEKQRAVKFIRGGASRGGESRGESRESAGKKKKKKGGGGRGRRAKLADDRLVAPDSPTKSLNGLNGSDLVATVTLRGPLRRRWRDTEEESALQRKPRGIVCVMTHNF